MMKKCFFCLFIIWGLSLNPVTAQKNLLLNPGFEVGLSGWESDHAKISAMVSKSGRASLALAAYQKGEWKWAYQKVKLPKNAKAIVVEGCFRLDQVENSPNSWSAAVIILGFNTGDRQLGDGISIVEKNGAAEWTSFKKNLRVPVGATGFCLTVVLSEASGAFFVDDLSIKVISDNDFEKENMVSKTTSNEK